MLILQWHGLFNVEDGDREWVAWTAALGAAESCCGADKDTSPAPALYQKRMFSNIRAHTEKNENGLGFADSCIGILVQYLSLEIGLIQMRPTLAGSRVAKFKYISFLIILMKSCGSIVQSKISPLHHTISIASNHRSRAGSYSNWWKRPGQWSDPSVKFW
jgi:hypothetical protein